MMALEPWQWALAAGGGGLLLGFCLGWAMLAARVRRKFGGLKVW
jgi:hypothetical protein